MVATGKMAYLLAKDKLSAFDRVKYLDLNRKKNALGARQGRAAKQLKALGEKASGDEGKALSQELEKIKAELSEVNSRMPSCFVWSVECAHPHELILAGDVLLAGGDDRVAAYSTKDGECLWSAAVEGKAHGLTAANGHLLVSTDTGRVHCFSSRRD